MKRKLVLLGVVAIAVMMLASLGFTAAQTQYSPLLQIKAKGMVWCFSTDADGDGVRDFNGNDIIKSSIVAYVYDNNFVYHQLNPILVLTTKNLVMLVFSPAEIKGLPDSTNGISGVTAILRNDLGDIVASGPGWTWGNIR